MLFRNVVSKINSGVVVFGLVCVLGTGGVLPAHAQQFPAFRQALAEGASFDSGVSAFYRDRDFAPCGQGRSMPAGARPL